MNGHKVWPANRMPAKEEIERMYRCAYYVDRSFFKPADLVDFGLDFYKLKEAGEVIMKKDLSKIRPHVNSLWGRMNLAQRTMFHYSYFVQGCNYLSAILEDMKRAVGEVKQEEKLIETLMVTLTRRFPEDLQEKVNDGFGKEWVQELAEGGDGREKKP